MAEQIATNKAAWAEGASHATGQQIETKDIGGGYQRHVLLIEDAKGNKVPTPSFVEFTEDVVVELQPVKVGDDEGKEYYRVKLPVGALAKVPHSMVDTTDADKPVLKAGKFSVWCVKVNKESPLAWAIGSENAASVGKADLLFGKAKKKK